MVGSGTYRRRQSDAETRLAAALGFGRRLCRALVYEKVTREEEDSPRVGKVHDGPVVLLAREPLSALVQPDQMGRFKPDRQRYLLAREAAFEQFGDSFHGPKRNRPFRSPQQAVSFVVVTLRYNDAGHNLCDGMLFV